MKNVLRLWDAFFDLASARAASQDDVPIAVALLDVLQTAGEHDGHATAAVPM
jgi:hypothetical protein